MIRPEGIFPDNDRAAGVDECTLLSMAGGDCDTIQNVETINTSSRNVLHRIRVSGSRAGSFSAVGKWYLPRLDRFYEHRFRREEKILDLLGKWFGGQTPRVFGGLILPGRFGFLLMQDLGPHTLETLVEGLPPAQRAAWLERAMTLLAGFHQVTRSHYPAFHRVVYSIELDRLTVQTYNRKLRIALNRLLHLRRYLDGATRADQAARETLAPSLSAWAGFERSWRASADSYNDLVVRALTGFPRTIVHNSYAPSHLLLHEDRLKLIDFETITAGPPQVDLAEFLRHPLLALGLDEVRTALKTYTAAAGSQLAGRADFERVFWLANVSRSLDYAGTLARRAVKALAAGRPAEAKICYNRCLEYLKELELSGRELNEGIQSAPFYLLVESIHEALSSAPLS